MNASPKKKQRRASARLEPPLAIAGSKANEVAADIRRRILSGELAQGQRLPSEDALANEAKVSRTTIRDALRILQLAGFVRRASLRIIVVSQPTDEELHREVRRALVRHGTTLQDVHEAILALAPAIIAAATERATAQDLKELRDILKEQEKSRIGSAEFSRGLTKFDEKIELMSRNPALLILRGPLRQLAFPINDFDSEDDELINRIIKRQHRMVDDIEAKDVVSASHMMTMLSADFREVMRKAGVDFTKDVGSLTDIA